MSKKHFIHIRRCHFCAKTTEKDGEFVDRCDHCQKSLGLFHFFDDWQVEPLSEYSRRPEPEANQVLPLRGLTAVW